MFTGLLTAIVFLPAAAAVVVLALKRDQHIRWFAIGATVAELVLTIVLFAAYDRAEGGVQFVDRIAGWIPIAGFEAEYLLGVDGLSLPLVLLTGILGAAAAFASWRISKRVKEYFAWLLILQTAVTGVFVSLDFLLFFVFWEIELLPMYFLISIWGTGRPQYSAMKFVIFTLTGSAFMLVGILALYLTADINTFRMVSVPGVGAGIPDLIEGARLIAPAGLIFAFLFIAFAVKLPLWPLHNWLPDAHTDAPTAVSVMLAGVLLKMGGYGLLRVSVGMFQDSPGFVINDIAWLLAALAVVSVLYGALVTLRQTDLKRLIAYSSVSHMGYVVLGVSSIVAVSEAGTGGLNGAALQLFTHGVITGLLFLLVGLAYDRTHTRYIPHLGGLAGRMPFIASAFLLAGLASLGLPGLGGFVAEIMVFLGTFSVWAWAAGLGAFGVVIAAGYVLWMVQRVFFGPRREHLEQVDDAHWVDMIPVAGLTVPIVLIGVYPSWLTDVFKMGIEATLRQ
jgi:NADH-quinone oxidoreductase subunit M